VNIFPIGTQIHNFIPDARDASTIYVSTYKGVFKSTKEDKCWLPVWLAPSKVEKSIIRFDPLSIGVIYIGTSTGVLLRSGDTGKTWEDITGILKGSINDIAIHPSSPEVIYVASGKGMFKTLNGAKSWGKIWAGNTSQLFLNLESPQEVYAIREHVQGSSFWYSKDDGANFVDITPKSIATRVDGPFGEETRTIEFRGLSYASLNPHDPGQLFASAYARYGGIYQYHFLMKSSDKGQSWEALMHRTAVSALAFAPHDAKVIYAAVADRILKSKDGGKRWTDLSTPYSQYFEDIVKLGSKKDEPYVKTSSIMAPYSDTLYVASNYSVYKTINEGQFWKPKSFGLPVEVRKREILGIDAHKKSIYIGDGLGRYGYWESRDEGFTWKWHSSPDKKSSSMVRQLVLTPGQTDYFVCKKGVFRRTPENESSPLNVPFPSHYSLDRLYTSPLAPKHLYAVGNAWAKNTMVLKSEDSGFSWMEIDWKKWIPPKLSKWGRWHKATLLAVDPQNPKTVYITVGAESRSKSAFLKTTDGGDNWVNIRKTNIVPESLVIDPTNSNIVYLRDNYRLFRSDDGGKTLEPIAPESRYIHDIAIDAINTKTLYLAADEGVYRSSDSGGKWELLDLGLLDTKVRRVWASSHFILAEGSNGIYKLVE